MAKILIVDDDTTFCIMLRKWLEKRGFEVDTAFSYKDAVKQLDKAGFDLVLTDLRLPDKDGIDLLRVIKEKTPETQVLLMTGMLIYRPRSRRLNWGLLTTWPSLLSRMRFLKSCRKL